MSYNEFVFLWRQPVWMAKNAGSTGGHLFGWPRMWALQSATYLDGQECGLYKWPPIWMAKKAGSTSVVQKVRSEMRSSKSQI